MKNLHRYFIFSLPKMEAPEEHLDIAQFNALPDELKEHIIRFRPDIITKLTRVNRNFYDLSIRPYLEKLCQLRTQNRELQEYIATQPLILGHHYCFSGAYTDYEIECATTVYIRRPQNDYIFVDLRSGINFSPLGLEISKGGGIAGGIAVSDNEELDLITQYNILRNRLGCVHRHATYAKEYILRNLDDRYHTVMETRNVNFDRNVTSQISLFQMLWMNSYSFNISPSISFPTGDIQDIPAFMNKINKEIIRLYTAIRKAVIRLD